jgi:hypothetical protein
MEQKYQKLQNKDKEYYKNKAKKYIRDHIEFDFLKGQELKYPEK